MVIMVLIYLVLYALMIWTYKNPRESLLVGKRGIFKEEPEPTEAAIRNMKLKAVYGIIFITIMIIFTIFLIMIEDKVVFL